MRANKIRHELFRENLLIGSFNIMIKMFVRFKRIENPKISKKALKIQLKELDH